eukprot:GHRQ01020239.1.p1 GENE.GHRQ01020239.1~~GHRQ01020239.1.p1  ORF type:complete len:216 (+),score=33.28 GHRQ01020239.1:63-710(+)
MPGGGGCMQLGLICRWFRLASPLIAATLPPARLVMHAVTCLAIRGDLAETRLDSSSTGMAPFRVCGVVCHADVTRRASQLLLAHRGLLTAPQLARLAAKMSEVGMTREITGLVDSSVASGSHQGQAVGFVAAALTGTWRRPFILLAVGVWGVASERQHAQCSAAGANTAGSCERRGVFTAVDGDFAALQFDDLVLWHHTTCTDHRHVAHPSQCLT